MSNVARHDVAIEQLKTEPWFCRLDSINYVTAGHRGLVILSGSHGGLYSASKGLSAAPRGLVLNDAGGGLNDAGIAALDAGDDVAVAVATIGHLSARIGDAADMQRRGIVSHANKAARAAGITAGMSCAEALSRMSTLAPSGAVPHAVKEHRNEIVCVPGAETIVCIDSASLIRPDDANRIVVTGSHGGLIGGDASKAINVACRFAAFNDGGGGCDDAGLGRLTPLASRNIAAVTVAHDSAEIGNAVSTFERGIISHANAPAALIGATAGRPLRDVLTQWLANADADTRPASPA